MGRNVHSDIRVEIVARRDVSMVTIGIAGLSQVDDVTTTGCIAAASVSGITISLYTAVVNATSQSMWEQSIGRG